MIQTALSNASYKHITFPAGLTFTIGSLITVKNLDHATIDFNGCTFIVPDSSANPGVIRFTECSQVVINDLIVDGNKDGNVGADQYGFEFYSNAGMTINNFVAKNITHHGFWCLVGNVGIKFYDCSALNIYGYISAAEIYLEGEEKSSIEFHNTIVSRDQYTSNQAFYCNSEGSVIIDRVTATNIAGYIVDVRRGTININDISVDHFGGMIIAQKYTNAGVVATNLIGTNWQGRAGVDAIIRILLTDSFYLDGLTVSADKVGWNNYAVRLSGSKPGDIVGVVIKNIRVDRYNTYGLLLAGLDDSAHFDGIKLNPATSDRPLIRCESTVTIPQYVTRLSSDVNNAGIIDLPGMLVVT